MICSITVCYQILVEVFMISIHKIYVILPCTNRGRIFSLVTHTTKCIFHSGKIKSFGTKIPQNYIFNITESVKFRLDRAKILYYRDVIMGAMASQITGLTIVYLTVYWSADQRKHQSSASLGSVMGIHRWPVNSSFKGPITRKLFPFNDVIMWKR